MSHYDIPSILGLNVRFGVDVQSIPFQSNCHKEKMSQWTKHPVDVLFGSKCAVDVPLMDVLSRHPYLLLPALKIGSVCLILTLVKIWSPATYLLSFLTLQTCWDISILKFWDSFCSCPFWLGKFPDDMQSSGVLILGALDLSSLVQRPSRSRLNLEINALVVETTRSTFVRIKRSGIYRIQNFSASSNEKVIKFFRFNVFLSGMLRPLI
jgi:hypothetical protein